MRKNTVFVATMLIAFVFGLQIAEPVAAASMKLVDHGSVKGIDSDIGYYKYSWVTYQKGTSYLKIKGYFYVGSKDHSFRTIFILQKLSKSRVKITSYTDGVSGGTAYDRTKLTGAQYYWRVFRPEMLTF